MDEYELRKRLAEALREHIFRIPRRHREYEMVMQPMIQVSNADDMKVSVRFELKYKKKNYPCRILVEKDGGYVHVSGVGAYLDKLFIKGRPEIICSEFIKWMKFARNGTINGDYAFMFYYGTPVGVMIKPANQKYSYAFFKKEIEECGLKAGRVFGLYSKIHYDGNEIDCQKMEDVYIPRQAFGKGLVPVNTIDLDTRRTLLWSMLCAYALNNKK